MFSISWCGTSKRVWRGKAWGRKGRDRVLAQLVCLHSHWSTMLVDCIVIYLQLYSSWLDLFSCIGARQAHGLSPESDARHALSAAGRMEILTFFFIFPPGKIDLPMSLAARHYKNIQGLAPRRCLLWIVAPLVHIVISTRHICVGWKWRSQLSWVIQAVSHDLVRRIRSWGIKSLEQDFKYLYWTKSKMIFWNLFTSKGI